MTEILIIVALFAVAAVLALRGKRGKALLEKLSPRTGWHITFSPGLPDRPTPQGAGWYFDFPTTQAHHLHYVQLFSPGVLVGASRITARFAVTGGGFVPQEAPDQTALVSLLIQRRGDDWSARGPMQSYRWYSNDVVELAAGEFELSVPLDVSAWGDVQGGRDAVAFQSALANVENVGLVFGAAGGRGHGVFAKEPSRFKLLEMHQ